VEHEVDEAVTTLEEALPPVAPERPKKRTRSVATPEQKLGLVIVVGISALLGFAGNAAPTGVGLVDGLYRGAFVAICAMACSRARRWTVVVAAAAAVIFSSGTTMLVALAGFALAVFMVGKDQRDRIYGAIVGAAVGFSMLRLQVDWFHGASALIAAIAILPALRSGYKNSRRMVRRRWRNAALVCAGVMTLGTLLAVLQAVMFNGALKDSVTATQAGIDATEAADVGAARSYFEDGASKFHDVAESASSWYFWPSRLVPVVAQNVAVVRDLATAGEGLANAAAVTVSEVDYESLVLPEGGVNLGAIAAFRDPVKADSDALAGALRTVARLDTPWVVGPLASKMSDFESRITKLKSQTDVALLALDGAPGLLGGSGERHYLLLMGNPAEARDIGGHIGNWAEVSAVDGRLQLVKVGTPLELALPALEPEVESVLSLPPSYLTMSPAAYPQNWGASVDFDLDAKIAATLYEKRTGVKVDGVLYGDPRMFAGMLAVTGPVQVPGTSITVNSENAVDFLTKDQFIAFGSDQAASDGVSQLVDVVMRKFMSTNLPGPKRLISLFSPVVKDGELRMATFHPEDAPLLKRSGLDVSLVHREGADLLSVVTRNANPSKIDRYLKRSTSYDVDWDPRTGALSADVRVKLTNEAPATGLPITVIGNDGGMPLGTNISDISILTPHELTEVTVDGAAAGVQPTWEGQWWRHSVRLQIPAGATQTVEFHLEGFVALGTEYSLRFVGQPLLNDAKVSVHVAAAKGTIKDGAGIDVNGGEATAKIGASGQYELTLVTQDL
jgi:hypothetical protein